MKQKLLTGAIIVMAFLSAGRLKAQDGQEKRNQFKSVTGISLGEYYQKYQSRKPSLRNNDGLLVQEEKTVPTKAGLRMPEKFWYPGEFEEVQAILITWPYVHWDISGRYYDVQPVNDSLGFREINSQVVRYKSVIDTTSETRLPIIFAKLASAIQKGNAEVWINICNPSDSLIIKHYMKKNGYTLEKYRFFVNPQNSFWYRDCGPVGFYYGNSDSIAFLDMEYYGGRPVDDLIPIRIAEKIGVPVYTTTFEFEGGNVLLDGAGTLFTSDRLYTQNQDTYGQYFIKDGSLGYVQKTPLSKNRIHDTLKNMFGLYRLEILQSLENDGGTAHIDLYAEMWDESNFVFTKYPGAMNQQIDYTISNKNADSMLSLYSVHGKPYRGRNIPLPKRDNDTWYPTPANFGTYTRTYSNNLFVNNVIIQPMFSDTAWGAREWDLKSMTAMQERFPGYEIIPIDIRGYSGFNYSGFDGTGGAIHCITKQIPADNPVRILHGSIQGYADECNGEFPIGAVITNKSGIASAVCYWRVKGDTGWNTLNLTAGPDHIFFAVLSRNAAVSADTIEYYIAATSNNGKTMRKPFTAPKGFYTFYHGTDTHPETAEDIYALMDQIQPAPNDPESPDFVSILSPGRELLMSENFYPNPAKDHVQILISDMNQKKIQVRVVNSFGQMVYVNSFIPDGDRVIFQLKTSSFKSGVYSVIFSNDEGKSTAKKLIIQ